MKHLSFGLPLCVLVVLATPTAFAFQAIQPFSADFSGTSNNGNEHITGKFYFSPPKIRINMANTDQRRNAGPFDGKMSIIIDGGKTAYMIMTEQQMYMEFPVDQNNSMTQRMPKFQSFVGDPCSVTGGATCKKLGTEILNGRTCDKWEMTKNANAEKETLWIDQRLHFPIKTQSRRNVTGDAGSSNLITEVTTGEFTNIKEGDQDAALFKVPPGYRKFDASAFARQRTH